MTRNGGANNYGVLFEYNPSNGTYTKKIDFDGSVMAAQSFGSLVQASQWKTLWDDP